MIEINLIPDVKQELIRAQRQRSTIISIALLTGIGAVGAVVLLALYVYGAQQVVSVLADNSIKNNNDVLSEHQDISKTLTIQNQLEKMPDVYAQKKLTSRVFDLLNAVIPPKPNDITISNLLVTTDEDRTIRIEGQAINSYRAVELFKKTIDAAEVTYVDQEGNKQTVELASEISTSDTSYGEDATGAKVLRFTMTFVYAEEMLSVASKDLKVAISTRGNVTDSYLGVPRSIFADRATDVEEN